MTKHNANPQVDTIGNFVPTAGDKICPDGQDKRETERKKKTRKAKAAPREERESNRHSIGQRWQ